ncbi:MAG: GNAT family N-acetyltransferase [Smithellaceae bacterium]|jgi:acyl-CoA hydrolase/GNAT superfamily N-acetyltransferase|nr:GNAT family N-acetyltransferase [Smithellaceae bacterium]MDD3258158.1 GNAT family N-acetyltransferase [Smithellaceae bacterium]MDD3848665.1 GNAT family N-acetyltransferase [Smithellaceae bacterium]
MPAGREDHLEKFKKRYPEKFVPEKDLFGRIRRGNSIFIGTACGEPQSLLNSLIRYVENTPHTIYGTQIIHIWTLGVAPYANKKFKINFRHNSFFISDSSRQLVNEGLADYTPTFLSEIPSLFRRGIITIDVALVQLSPPDEEGLMSLGVSVDIVKSAVEQARLVIAQVNHHMPRVRGDAMVDIRDVDFILPHDEPILEYTPDPPGEETEKIGTYVSRIVQDGDTIQVGYGTMPNAILAHLSGKRDLGVHTELLTDGIIDLMKKGVVTNAKKSLDRKKTVASFCMGSRDTYRFLNDNPAFEFRPIDYTNSLFVIGRQANMTAINSALEIDLTGQATAESIGGVFYSGVGGQADFMRGSALAPGGKSILAMRSTSIDMAHSRIVPCLSAGASATLIRGDVHYVVTEYGTAYLHGKNIRERAMALISIAHPRFRPWLVEQARERGLIYRDQAFIPGTTGVYPEHLETYRSTRTGLPLFLRPVKISDEGIIKAFLYSLSDKSIYTRFFTNMVHMPHNILQKYVIIDYSKEMLMLAIQERQGMEEIVGMGQYIIDTDTHTAAASFLVGDVWQNRGIGIVLLEYLTEIAKRDGLLGFSATVLAENKAMLRLFERMNFQMEKQFSSGVYELTMGFYPREP